MTYEHVAIAFVHPHEYSALFGTSLWRTVAACPGIHVIDLGSGPMIASARNEIALAFMDSNADILLMADADMAFSPAQLQRLVGLVDDDSPIVGGLCFVVGRSGILEPTLKVTDPVNGGLKVVWEYPKNALVSIDATGGAFLAVHRQVFVKLLDTYGDQPYPFFADTSHGGIPWGEDITMCIRARQQGFPVKCHTGIDIGHIKPYVYTEDDYVAQQAELAVVGEDAVKHRYLVKMGLLDRDVARAAPEPRAAAQIGEGEMTQLATVGDLIQQTKRLLTGSARGGMNRLSSDIDAVTAGIPLDFDPGASLAKSGYISIDDEIMYVWEVTLTEATVQRAQLGTQAATHAGGTLIEVNARFPQAMIRDALYDEIMSWPKSVYRTRGINIDVPSNSYGVDLGSIDPLAYDVLEVLQKPVTTSSLIRFDPYSTVWRDVGFRLERGMDTAEFPSGPCSSSTMPTSTATGCGSSTPGRSTSPCSRSVPPTSSPTADSSSS